jgi:cell wall-associated NlpC family hydrolase
MKMPKSISLFFLFIFLTVGAAAQVKEFDHLEMFYAQKHYKLVLRKANRLLDNPEYDYSQVPAFYSAMATMQLVQNDRWRKSHPNALQNAQDLFLALQKTKEGQKILTAHIHELSFLKRDLISWAEDLKRRNKKDDFSEVQGFIEVILSKLPNVDSVPEGGGTAVDESELISSTSSKERQKLVQYAEKYIGTPYVWAGENPSGFDCSGFTSYVYKSMGKELPRRAVDQYNACNKIKERAVQKGDLVYFDNGSGVSHVGMVISEKVEPVVMIHASSSQGVIRTAIDSSDYWKSRLKGYGTFVD